MNKKIKRYEELLISCISYIDCHIESYSDMIDTFKRLGFTEKELEYFDIRDFDLENELLEEDFDYEF